MTSGSEKPVGSLDDTAVGPPKSPSSETKTSSASLVGCRVGDYQVLRKLGRGGMADVYAARHLSLGRDVALKILRSELAQDGDYVKRFRREARASAKLNHPHIAQVYDVGSVDCHHYIAQELIDGCNLREYLTDHGTLDAPEATEVLLSVASALELAADAGITHRDIKPENLMRSSRGVLKVADFGLSRLTAEPGASNASLTRDGLTLGTPRYMSPEQVQGKNADVRSDLYSLGVSMYHLLAGRPPFEAEDPLALAVMHLHDTPEPLDRARGNNDLPEWLVAIVSRMMQKNPEDRFQSPAELLDAVRSEAAVSSGAFTMVGAAAATIRLQRVSGQLRQQRRRRLMKRAAIAALPLGAILMGGWLAARRPLLDVGDLLNPDEVIPADTVEEQYMVALVRNKPKDWKAVSERFPPEANSVHALYDHKAKLQLARSYIESQRWREAGETIDRLLESPNATQLHLALAWVLRFDLTQMSRLPNKWKSDEARTRVQALYREMELDDRRSLDIFKELVSEQKRSELGIIPTGSPS
ncbi:MAG: serine/threonine-protein kinase [Planctomycetota bacterium]